jgi:hypothetical protein
MDIPSIANQPVCRLGVAEKGQADISQSLLLSVAAVLPGQHH